MLRTSQPLDPKFCKKYELNSKKSIDSMNDQNIKQQRIGKMLDVIDAGKKRKISLKTRIRWKWRRITDVYYDTKHTIRNHVKWHRAMRKLRPWLGHDGVITVMQAHLQDYVFCEEKYGTYLEEYKKQKIASAKETIRLLERMKDPDEYSSRRRKEVDAKYPKYQTLITEYNNGGAGYSGKFITQGSGWAGRESGKDPREGYFEFVDGRFELVTSPDQNETDRILNELSEYHKEVTAAYQQAEADSDYDFERLGQLLKDNLYQWWD